MSLRHLVAAPLAAALVTVAAGTASAAVSGPDVASFQHPSGASITWSAMKKAGQSFVFIKATEGTGYTNPYFASDWKGSGAAGIDHAAYHFARPSATAGSAVAQAKHFAAAIGKQTVRGTLPPVLDLEVTGGLAPAALRSWVSTWLAEVRTLTGRTPMIYTYVSFWRTDMGNSTAYAKYPLWIAEYGVSAPAHIGGWSTWTFWQYSSTSRIAGISGKTDMNRFNGSTAALARLSDGAAVATSTPVTTPAPAPGTPAPTTPPSSGTGSSTSSSALALRISAPTTAVAGQSFTLSGTLVRGRTPLADVPVTLTATFPNGFVATLATLSTDSSGRWWAQVSAPPVTVAFQVTARVGSATVRSSVATVAVSGGYGYGYGH